MLSFISRLFRSFILRGTSQATDEFQRRSIWLLHVFYLTGTFTYFAALIETYLVDGASEGNIVLLLALFFQLGLIPLLLRRYELTQLYMVFASNCTLFVFENRHGPVAGTYLFFFPLLMMVAFLVDFRKFYFAVINILITIGFIIAAILLRYRFLYRHFPEDQDIASFQFNLVISGFMTATIAVIIIGLSRRQYRDFIVRIEERRKAEESMKLVIREKETLLAEIHHRVKNNLAVISSLLNLQMNTVTNEYTRNVLRDSRNRVASMSLIHQKLYRNTNVEEIDFGRYASDLVDEIRFSYPEQVAENIKVAVDAQEAKLPLTVAVPSGLILNELLSNCYKHAFPGGKPGQIGICFGKAENGSFFLEVSDNGKGLPADFSFTETESLGMTIIQSLTEQIDARWTMRNGGTGGVLFRMEFGMGGKK